MKDGHAVMDVPCTRLSCLRLHPHSHAVCCQYGLQACLCGAALTSPYLDALESLHWLGSYKHRALQGQAHGQGTSPRQL